ncbi:response regulator transcription factor (plasmid) [Pantoea dispersa]|uniref:response regulator transcription factor n=1 Tax=Pantoea dispersa TaxID=59814 RepID=UPI001CA621D7|nr:response regulator transcription factor [Pantoea dispersa]QZY92935.1 response regulator transcription factor [Pantoea dispersa]
MKKVKVIILDDHPIFLEGLKKIINSVPRFAVSDCCKNSRELFFSLSVAPAHIALIDASLPKEELNLHSLVDQLALTYPNMIIVTMGDSLQQQQFSDMLKPKVKCYFCKSFSLENWITGLSHIWTHHCNVQELKFDDNQNMDKPSRQLLSEKEKAVIEYLYAGLSVSQTALLLSRSVKTISSQKRAAMRKLGFDSESEIFRMDINLL